MNEVPASGPIPQYLLSDTAEVDERGVMSIGGVSLLDLAAEFGTPAFIFDEQHLINRCNEAVAAFPDGVAYASKSFLCKEMARIATAAGMRLDVASGGELFVAVSAGVDPENLVFHGNNKSIAELARAIEVGVGSVVIDSFDEIERIESLEPTSPVPVSVRVTPGVEAHTHEYIKTAQEDTKFGMSLASGEAQRGVDRIKSSKYFRLVGAHAHIGSQIFDLEPFGETVGILAEFITKNQLEELSIGGGLGVPYVTGERAPSITEWGKTIKEAVLRSGLPSDIKLHAEPGRSISAPACVTLYTVGTIKKLPGIRTYLAVDGGMGENPRPVLYGSGYEAFLPRAPLADRPEQVTIVGKHCESGDFIIKGAQIPENTQVGDVLATPVTGAYGYSLSSNYNKVPRPPVIFVRNGEARVVVRRETYEDLIRFDL